MTLDLAERLPGQRCSRAIVAGIGLSSAADAGEIVALVQDCFREAGLQSERLTALVSDRRKEHSPALAEAGRQLGVPVLCVDTPTEFNPDTVAGRLGLSGVAELAAGSAGPLLLPKRKSRFATCALAQDQGNCRASMAPSTPSASVAGP